MNLYMFKVNFLIEARKLKAAVRFWRLSETGVFLETLFQKWFSVGFRRANS